MNKPSLLRRFSAAGVVLLASTASLATSPWFEVEFDCTNQIDDDGDDLIDLADPDCNFPTPRCGDGFSEPNTGERCDDGNVEGGDGCRADCRGIEACGDGLADPATGEVCDDGNTSDGDACSFDCQSIVSTSFLSANDINDLNITNATTAVFGEAVVTRPFGASRLLVVLASSDAQLCDSIAAAGFEPFFSSMLAGQNAAPVALITAEKLADPSPFAAPVALQSGSALLIDGGFLIGDGAAPLVDTLFSGGLDGSLTLQSISATDIAGQYDGVQEFEFVNDAAINVGLQGIFIGARCQPLSDGLQTVFGQ